jgi:hypothetical protein
MEVTLQDEQFTIRSKFGQGKMKMFLICASILQPCLEADLKG